MGFFQSNTCTFNLKEILGANFQNFSFKLNTDAYSSVECHGKINGADLVNGNLKAYVGTNVNIDFLIQSLFWLFCISLIPKNKDQYIAKYNTFTIGIVVLIFLIYFYGERSVYSIIYENFEFNYDNYFLLSLVAGLVLIMRVQNNLIKTRFYNLVNYFPYLFLIIGSMNGFNFNFFIFLLIYLGLQSSFQLSNNRVFTTLYSLICIFILSFQIIGNKNNERLFFDVDKLKGFTSSTNSLGSLVFWIITYYLIVCGLYYVIKESLDYIDLNKIKINLLITGALMSIIGVLSSLNSVINFFTYYYLGLNKLGIQQFTSIEGNTWRGLSASAEGVGEFYCFVILFSIIYNYLSKRKFTIFEVTLIVFVAYGLFRANNFAAFISLVLVLSVLLFNENTNLSFKTRTFIFSSSTVVVLITLFSFTNYSYKYLSEAIIYQAVNNSSFNYELPKNEVGQTAIELSAYGEILELEDYTRSTSTSLYNFLKIYNSDRNIKNIPHVISVVSAVSVPINRSEKWGIFIAKYNPDISKFLFGYGPNQLAEYYKSHKTKVNDGLVLPHSSFLDYLIFFGLLGTVFIFFYIAYLIYFNLNNKLFLYLVFFQLINLIKSDSLLYLNSFVLLIFVLNLTKLENLQNEK